jgi:Holliday junction DNA helicase RuvA
MIDQIRGTVLTFSENSISCFVGDIAFEVFIPTSIVCKQGACVTLWIHMHWSAEQGPLLYGFEQQIERTIFRLIISCSGVGPKLGLAVLAQLGTDLFVSAVVQADAKAISQVSGIGSRKAEQIILHLKHKINDLLDKNLLAAGNNNTHWLSVSQALESLGYSKIEVQQTLGIIKKESSSAEKFDILLKKALSLLAR